MQVTNKHIITSDQLTCHCQRLEKRLANTTLSILFERLQLLPTSLLRILAIHHVPRYVSMEQG